MRNDFESNYLAHWGLKKGAQSEKHKYVARVEIGEKNGKMQYRYFYTMREWLAYLKDETKKKFENLNKNKEDIFAEKINIGVKKLEDLYNHVDTNNKYMTDDYNYDKKIAEVKKSAEWRKIVRTKDPEYTRYDKKTGQVTYDIDSYLAKKKHPVLDVADDVVSGRNVKINKVEKEALAAGVADYAKTYVSMAAIGTKFLLEKFKFSQGSYKDEKQQAIDYYEDNKEKIAKNAQTAQTVMSNENAQRIISDGEKIIDKAMQEYGNNPALTNGVSQIQNSVSREDYEEIKREYEQMQKELEEYKRRANKT